MTFTIPESLAKDFQNLIPDRLRSRLVAKLLDQEIAKRKASIVKACQIVSSDTETNTVVAEWQGFDEKIEGPEW